MEEGISGRSGLVEFFFFVLSLSFVFELHMLIKCLCVRPCLCADLFMCPLCILIAKATNGQPSCDQDARRSDAEMEVDAETAEKENEEALSLLDQMKEGGQVVTEPVVMKKKKKRKKKDSEQEPENPSDGKAAPAEITEGKGSRKKSKNRRQ